MSGYRVTCAAPPTRPFPRPGAWSLGGRPLPRRLGPLVYFGFASCPLFRNNDRIGSELRAARVDLGVLGGWLPAFQMLWEPEMGANVFRRPQTQRDVARIFSQVKGSPFDSFRQ
jgi:hypothetical protein